MRPTHAKDILTVAEVPALLLTDTVNVRYLSGIPLTAGAMLITQRRMLLFVDARYRYLADKSAYRGITVRDIADLPAALKDIPECGFESEEVTVHRKSQWKRKFPNTKFIQTYNVCQTFRRSKSPEEFKLMRRAYRITLEMLRRVPSALKRPTTEERLARQLQVWALELGADGLSFDPIVAFGTHTSSPHHHPTSRTLKKGHIVQIDVGAKYRGYCADASEVYFTATPTVQQQQLYALLCAAQKKAMNAARAGASTRSLDALARDVLRKGGVEEAFTHSLGHGIGLEVHEGVSLSSKGPDTRLVSHEVVTIEPGVYFPGKFGMRVEQMKFIE